MVSRRARFLSGFRLKDWCSTVNVDRVVMRREKLFSFFFYDSYVT